MRYDGSDNCSPTLPYFSFSLSCEGRGETNCFTCGGARSITASSARTPSLLSFPPPTSCSKLYSLRVVSMEKIVSSNKREHLRCLDNVQGAKVPLPMHLLGSRKSAIEIQLEHVREELLIQKASFISMRSVAGSPRKRKTTGYTLILLVQFSHFFAAGHGGFRDRRVRQTAEEQELITQGLR